MSGLGDTVTQGYPGDKTPYYASADGISGFEIMVLIMIMLTLAFWLGKKLFRDERFQEARQK